MSESPQADNLNLIRRFVGIILRRPLLFAALILVFGGAVFGLTFWGNSTPKATIDEQLAQALEHLEREEFEEARQAAETVSSNRKLRDDQRGLVAYILGVTLARLECERERRPERRVGLYMIAARYFEEASLQGVPAEYQKFVDFWNGQSLILSQQQILARGPLERALISNPDQRGKILVWLGEAYLADAKLPKEKGVQYMDQLLAEFPTDGRTRDQALSLKARLLLSEDRLSEARPLWEALPLDATNRLDLQIALGQYYLRTAFSRRQLRADDAEVQAAFQDAVQVLSDQAGVTSADNDLVRGQLLFLLGQAQKGAGYPDQAAENFSYVRRQYFDHPLGIAAGFWEAQAQLEAGELAEAYRHFSSLLKETVRPNIQGDTDWLNQDAITTIVETAVDRYILLGDCATAVKLADEFRSVSTKRTPAIPLANSARLRVNALKRWTELLEKRFGEATYQDRPNLEVILQDKYREYANSLYSLAINRYASEHYTTDLYNAAEYFFKGKDYHRAILAFQQCLDTNELRFAAQCRLRIGQSQLAQRQFAEAANSLENCWTLFPNDPVVYQARYDAAECYMELSQPEIAEQMLLANLENDKLTPSSQEWLESLFLLGSLLFDQGKVLEARSDLITAIGNVNSTEDPKLLMEQSAQYYARAIGRLSEAVQRAPQSNSALDGYYRLADAYRRYNRWHEFQMSLTTVSARRTQIGDSIRRYDEQAIRLLEQLEERLFELREQQPLDPIQERLLRNSYFLRGQLFQRLGQFDSAILAYRTVSNMVIQEPEVLEAYTQIASCYRRSNRHDEAIRVINQAKILLRDRIPADADFEATTRFPRERWVTMLDWLATI